LSKRGQLVGRGPTAKATALRPGVATGRGQSPHAVAELVSSVEVAQFMVVAPSTNPTVVPCPVARPCRRRFAAGRGRSLPGATSPGRRYSLARGFGPWGQHRPHRRSVLEMGQNPSPLSSWSVPGTTRSTQRARHCLAARPPDSRRLLLAGHSRTAAFEARGRPDPAPVTTPAAAALPRLVMDVPQSVTLLAGVTPRAAHRMSRAPARA
jgi:hypothetical protein